ncbi:hypothetical protein INQ51_10840 [Maribellus sp. CM-23]|uniref:hypothetical protein n=1 Tax=Maribellus sp. CM-23 TaxID=2781026 RepID=UPI001F2AAFCF|nr:hypothetical protein [Maribellus sp. CM-23]MCE4564807.1 hypothetical protein [Maribellus sp. CM-23]
MKNPYSQRLSILTIVAFLLSSFHMSAQDINREVVSFKKREVNAGWIFQLGKEREELRTDVSRFFEDQTSLNGGYRIENTFWNIQDYRQDELNFSFDLGPFGAYGNWIDSSKVSNLKADQYLYGLRSSANLNYRYRYYYDAKNYTAFEFSGWGRYEVYRQSLDGTSIDSLGVVTDIDRTQTEDRLRYGFQARGGFGIGRLSPMNHLMAAHFLLEKYYPGRIFSDYEIAQFAQVIAQMKNDRDFKEGHDTEKEMAALNQFLNGKFLLEPADAMLADWPYAEFDPRYEGKRFEMGPFFKYFNQEPDFIWGGYIQYEDARYKNVNWNRNFSAGLTYNRYKKPDEKVTNSEDGLHPVFQNSYRDWMTAEIDLGWSYYSQLRSRFNFGVKYVPGIDLNGFKDLGTLSHNFVPYVGYFSQLSSKSRIRLDFSWRIADGEQFMVSGPEFSLGIYRSSY